MNYLQYYQQQAGGATPIFRGVTDQRGHGLGGMFSKLFRFIMPLFKSHALPVLKSGAQIVGGEAIKAAANIATDAINGKNIKNSFQENYTNAIDTVKNQAIKALQKGSGIKRKRSQKGSGIKRKRSQQKVSRNNKNNKNKLRRNKIRRLKDIFDY